MSTNARTVGIAGLVTGIFAAVLPATPAAAYAPGGTATSAGVLVADWGRIDFYLNRPATQRLAKALDQWDKTSQAPAEVATVLLCTKFPTIWGEAACTAALVIVGSYPLDQLAAAGRSHSCLHIGLGFGLAAVGPDNGENCLGART